MTPAIVIDANIMVGALLGRTLPLIAELAQRVPVVTPPAQLAETRRALVRLGKQDVDRAMRALMEIVEPLNATIFAPFESRARERLHERSQPDWPVLAAAMALGAGIWSRDPDLFGTGVPMWFTRNIRFAGVEA